MIVLMTAGAASAEPLPSGVPGSWTNILNEEFNGSALSTALWTAGWQHAGGISGPVSERCFSSNLVAVAGGTLQLQYENQSATCGSTHVEQVGGLVESNPNDGVAGHSGFSYSYGDVEWRVYLPGVAKSGCAGGTCIANWPAVWSEPTDNTLTPEIDTMEGLPNFVEEGGKKVEVKGSACFHFHPPFPENGACASGSYAGWHTFDSDWEPSGVTYYYDGKKVGELTSTGNRSQPQYLIMDQMTPYGNDPKVVNQAMQIDYVRVWQHPKPSVTTGEVSNLHEVEVQEAEASLNGSVNPNGNDTHYYFQYGPTTSYGSTAPALPGTDIGSGTSSVAASTIVTGLPGGTLYHYRLVATNGSGTTYGADRTFETPLEPFVNMQEIGGVKETVLEGPNHSLVQHWSTSEGWKTFTIAGEGTTYSSPQFFVSASGTLEIFVQGPEHTLMQYWSTSEGWKHFQITGPNEVYSNPVMQEVGGITEAVVQGPNHSLVQHWSTSEGWKTFTIAGEGTTYSSPQFVQQGPYQEVYVQGPEHTLVQYWATSEGWKHFQITGTNEVFSNPVLQEIGGVSELVVQGPNHSLVQHWSTSEGWKAFTIAGEGTTYSSPQFEVLGSVLEIFVQGPTHTLMQYWSTSEGWKHFQITGSNEVYSHPVAQKFGSGPVEVYVEGPSNTLVQHWTMSEGWGTFTVANNAFS
jgi:hypothetical protein